MAKTTTRTPHRGFKLQPGITAHSADGALGKPFVFLADHGVRETIEAVLIAVVLAMLFRTFQAENFIIPTGSMAPRLMGQHMDVTCAKCDYAYQAGSSQDSWLIPVQQRRRVTHTQCPICGFRMAMEPRRNADHVSNQGDRIVVDKFLYDFIEPERFEVIVFKNPNNGKQNYIKRLIGLPGEQLTLEHGDVFLLKAAAEGEWTKEIVRKPAHKVRVMLQLVDDTHHIPKELMDAHWPLRWQAWGRDTGPAWETVISQGRPLYQIDHQGADVSWLRYRHLFPQVDDWHFIEERGTAPAWVTESPGRLIGDFYAYNASEPNHFGGNNPNNGMHWVGDLALQAQVDIARNSGKLSLDIVEGGVHFTCEIDCATGATGWRCSHPDVVFVDEAGQAVPDPSGTAPISNPGVYDVMFANVDDQLWLWINGRSVALSASKYRRARPIYPQWSDADPGDAEPVGIGVQGLDATISRLRVWRDVYYTSARGGLGMDARNEYGVDARDVHALMQRPALWNTEEGRRVWDRRDRPGGPMFVLQAEQYLPMGDNSPESLDGRVWPGPNFVDRGMLIGRALYVFWPHPLNRPIPYFPNFGKMRRIR